MSRAKLAPFVRKAVHVLSLGTKVARKSLASHTLRAFHLHSVEAGRSRVNQSTPDTQCLRVHTIKAMPTEPLSAFDQIRLNDAALWALSGAGGISLARNTSPDPLFRYTVSPSALRSFLQDC